MELKDILSLVIALLGVVAAAAAAYAALTSKKSADRSASAADRSADAATLSARSEEESVTLQKKLASVNIVAQTLKEYVSDAGMKIMFYKIDYNKFRYDRDTRFQEPADEYELDKLLSHFSTVALAWKNGVTHPDDLVIVKYYVIRIMRNPGVILYVEEFLRKWVKRNGIDKHPFELLVELRDFLEGRNL